MLKGDGWMHAGGDGEELDRLLARLAEIRTEEGDTRDDFEVHVISYDAYDLDGIKRLEDKGVTDCIVGFRVPYIKGPDTEPLEKKIEHLERYAETIIQQGQRVTVAVGSALVTNRYSLLAMRLWPHAKTTERLVASERRAAA